MAPLAIALLLLGACENIIEPFSDGTEDVFVVTGFLDTHADTQLVRVSTVRRTLEQPDEAGPQPTVTLTNLQSQESRQWEHAPLVLDDGSLAHLFFDRLPPEPGASYRLDVTRSDGASTAAFTRVPADPQIRFSDPDTNVFGAIEQAVFWTSEERPNRLLIRYDVASRETGKNETVVIQYEGPIEPTDGGWSGAVSLESDFRRVSRRMEILHGDPAVVLFGISIEMELLSSEWTDPPASNIESGRGFFASVATFVESWQLDEDIAIEIGYSTPD